MITQKRLCQMLQRFAPIQDGVGLHFWAYGKRNRITLTDGGWNMNNIFTFDSVKKVKNILVFKNQGEPKAVFFLGGGAKK